MDSVVADMQVRIFNTGSAGFTLVELVTTIIIIAILAVAVLPRLFSSSSYSAYSLRNEFIGELRQVQLRALNNTDRCYQVNVTDTAYQATEFASRVGNACQNLIRSEELQSFVARSNVVVTATNAANFSVVFDNNGKLLTPTCNGACFTVKADEQLSIAVSSEGYIYVP